MREFEQSPPNEVIQKVSGGMYFLRAWHRYRTFSIDDVADLFGKTRDTIYWHEHGYSRQNENTLTRFAEIFDCPVGQLTAKRGSNTQPWLTVIRSERSDAKAEPRSPDDTDYPDAVLAHLIAGKSLVTAWRLYRNLTIAQFADAYGTSPSNAKMLEQSSRLRQKTIDRLCPIFGCKPAQLLRPLSMPDNITSRHRWPLSSQPPNPEAAQRGT